MFTITQAWKFYIEERCNPRGVDIRRTRYMARTALQFFGPSMDAAKIDRAAGRRYKEKRLADGVQPATVRRELAILHAALQFAANEEKIPKAPKFDMPPSAEPRTRFLTSEECERVINHPMPERLRLFFWLALETAARARAIEELTWNRVDFQRRVLDYRVPGVRYKNKRRGEVGISSRLYEVLLEASKDKAPTDYVIGVGPSGRPTTTYHQAKAIMRAVGIDENGVARHVCRKTWASHAALNDVPMKKIAAVLHDNVLTVDKSYAFLKADQLVETMDFRKGMGA